MVVVASEVAAVVVVSSVTPATAASRETSSGTGWFKYHTSAITAATPTAPTIAAAISHALRFEPLGWSCGPVDVIVPPSAFVERYRRSANTIADTGEDWLRTSPAAGTRTSGFPPL